MKRLGLGIMGGALLVFLLPMTLSSCAITCGCLSTPDPNWTPAPIASGLAAQDAAEIAGVPYMTVQFVPGLNGRQFYRATAPDVIAFVDAISGTVLEVVFMETMPGSVAPSVPTPTDGPTDTDARRAAEAFMTGRGMPTNGFPESSVFRTVARVGTYDITWSKASNGVSTAFYQVSVNAISATVYAFLDLRMQLPLTVPVVGRARATALATDKMAIDAAQVTSVEFAIDFSSGAQLSTWDLRLGGALVRIDAATGGGTTVES
jgi:hypothetical protein